MKYRILTILMIAIPLLSGAQDCDTFLLHYGVSKNDTVIYKRIIRFDQVTKLYMVRDYYPSGQIQMEAGYSAFDKTIKEGWQCNYLTNTKEGPYKEWWKNGQLEFSGNFRNGLADGRCQWWYQNGQSEADEGRRKGQLHGRVRYWTDDGALEHDFKFYHGNNVHREIATYSYLPNLPGDYDTDTLKKWPLIIFLHGGSQRGTNLRRLYDTGIPDQVYRGRDFPFIIISPLCPLHLRWSTDDWFPTFYRDITARYRIDTTRIYLTGLSLGGEGTWYLAARYPEKFAAIAPISGFTSESDYINKHISNLIDIPIWAFHGKIDNVVPFEETERMVRKIEQKNKNLRFTAEPAVGHWMHWIVYPWKELYNWFLKYKK
jgi:pimeloyl-ACP methyl ester carboxylesterase